MADHRPIPGDPGASAIQDYFDANEGEPWLLSQSGDFMTFAAETFTSDGGNYQKVVAIDIPVRRNHGTEKERLRLFLSPVMASELVVDIANALSYL